MSVLPKGLARWLPLGLAITMVCGIVYAVTQQTYRRNANDPQVMVAHDIAAGLEAGKRPDELVSRETVDPSKSLAPFVIIFDADRHVVASTLEIGGKTPAPPAGVLAAAKATGENRVTWQPRPDARIASVVVPVKGGAQGYVLAGRSLAVVEERVSTLTLSMGVGWAATMVATLLASLVAARIERPER
jgi:hypothetical protein